ncbi:Eco57I restriction-modification methylase domain-containing protein [Microbulbifer harenosus]|uniref:site-specific DNA-methyltransferase (adenine-specific) n=1 Tax=Microbulbifer harenosus TaxID=2576840 RepID=A0ABY2UP07_9GAMM|nr:N-6 DNA methylase [Microbulbifer harenosus]TLM78572.1 type II restriction endonuclease subunit M [Microbulbifer harenosus]
MKRSRNSSDQRYAHVESRKQEGAHYTPDIIADFIADNMIASAKLGKEVCIADPAVGDGELLISLLKRLGKKSKKSIRVFGFDTNRKSLQIAETRIRAVFPDVNLTLLNRDFLQVCLEKGGLSNSGDLFAGDDIPPFDLLIANPPYIRTQVLGADHARQLSKCFGLKGRVDIYQAFLIAMKAVMKPDAICGVIVSNRFMTVKGAEKFREKLYESYSILGVWDFGDTRVFDAAVLPAVIIMSTSAASGRTNSIPFSSVYLADGEASEGNLPHVRNQVEALQCEGLVSAPTNTYRVSHGILTFDVNPGSVWRLECATSEQWLKKVSAKTWCTFKDVGKIRVGVKTTADNVFIRQDWKAEVGIKPELLMPLTTHHVAGHFRCNDKPKKTILYTHTVVNGKRASVDLAKYPRSKKYLEEHREQLAGRSYVIKAKRQWFEIWVPQNPALWKREKVIFRDIAEHPTFWMDEEGTVVNGDCYWMLRDNTSMPEDILWLVLAVANSTFIERFYDVKFQNKLYANKRRFISQYVEQFPLPDPSGKRAQSLINLAKECYLETRSDKKRSLEARIDKLVWTVFGVSMRSDVTD